MNTLAPAASRNRSHRAPVRTRLRGLALVAVLALLTLLVVKLEFKSPDSNDVFYAYGVLVTAVVLVTMTVAFGFYRDPALVARDSRPELDPATALGTTWPLVSCIVAVHNEQEFVAECVASIAARLIPAPRS